MLSNYVTQEPYSKFEMKKIVNYLSCKNIVKDLSHLFFNIISTHCEQRSLRCSRFVCVKQ